MQIAPTPTALLFQIHFFDRWAARQFGRLCAQCPPHFSPFVLMHVPPGTPKPRGLARVPHHFVTTPEIRDPAYPGKSRGPGWNLWSGGHTDLIALHFFRSQPHFARYWVVEYDIRFSGDWRRFFKAFEASDADLLTTAVMRQRDSRSWLHWPTLEGPAQAVGDEFRLRAFMPIFRASQRLCMAVDGAYRDGWGGHVEATWPTIASHRGFRVEDIGGDGEFTPPERQGRFYTSTPSDPDLCPGSLMFKPVLFRPGSHRDMLWHPVKPWLRHEIWEAKSLVRRVWSGARRRLGADRWSSGTGARARAATPGRNGPGT